MKKFSFLILLLLTTTFGFGQGSLGCIITNKASGGVLTSGTTCTVDNSSYFNVRQTTAGQTITVPNSASSSIGRLIYISNDSISGSVPFTLVPGGVLSLNQGVVLRWQGAKWTVYGARQSVDDYLPKAGGVMTGSISASGQISVDPVNRRLRDSAGNLIYDYNGSIFYGASGIASLYAYDRYAQSADGNLSFNWNSRNLYNSSGATLFNWSGTFTRTFGLGNTSSTFSQKWENSDANIVASMNDVGGFYSVSNDCYTRYAVGNPASPLRCFWINNNSGSSSFSMNRDQDGNIDNVGVPTTQFTQTVSSGSALIRMYLTNTNGGVPDEYFRITGAGITTWGGGGSTIADTDYGYYSRGSDIHTYFRKLGGGLLTEFRDNGNIGINLSSYGGGVGVIAVGNATTIPSSNPTGGFILYVDPADNKLKARGPSGTVTEIANP